MIGGSAEWQTAVLLAFGSSLAVTFGFTPVLVDPALLFLFCLGLAALCSGRIGLAIGVATLAALTKEFGILLGVVCAIDAYRRRSLKLAALALLLPIIVLGFILLFRRSDTGIGFGGWSAFTSHFAFEYQLSVLKFRGLQAYSQLLYMWAWCGVWPIVLLSTHSLLTRLVSKRTLNADEMMFGVALITLPILVLGDWSRSLIVFVPFACIVATNTELSRDRLFCWLLGVGGLATALARPLHGETQPPFFFTLTMMISSAGATILLLIRFVRFAVSYRRLQPIEETAREALLS